MQTTFLTAASAPSGSPPWRPSRCASPCFSWSESTSKATVTVETPNSRTLSTTAFSKCARIGQPSVVSETTTSTRPSSGCSIERTIPRETMSLRSSGSMTLRRASSICSRGSIGFDDGTRKKANAAPEGTAPAEGGEILHWRRVCGHQPYPGSGLLTGRGEAWVLGERRDARDDGLHLLLGLAASDLHLLLDPAAVLLHRAHGLRATLTQLPLHAGASALDATDRAVAGRRATPLELAEVGVDALLELLELLLGAVAAVDVRLVRVEHGVTRLEGGAHRDQQGTLGLSLDDLKRVQLGLGTGLRGLAGGGAALGGVATTSRSGLVGGRLALGGSLSSHSFAPSPRISSGSGRTHWGCVGDLIRSKFGRSIPTNTCT